MNSLFKKPVKKKVLRRCYQKKIDFQQKKTSRHCKNIHKYKKMDP